MYSIEESTVKWEGRVIYDAPGAIKTHFNHQGNIILHYKVDNNDKPRFPSEEIARNVLSLDFNGNVIWRLQMPERGTLPFQPNYQSLRIDDEGNFWAGDSRAYENRFDPNTGGILESVFTK